MQTHINQENAAKEWIHAREEKDKFVVME